MLLWSFIADEDAIVRSCSKRLKTQEERHNGDDDEDVDDAGRPFSWIKPGRTGKKKLCKADLEGPPFNLIKAFHKNNVFLQYQMDECHKLLTISAMRNHEVASN
ncbi:hypothetical protein Tco_0003271 [Tanacetum coccineum]